LDVNPTVEKSYLPICKIAGDGPKKTIDKRTKGVDWTQRVCKHGTGITKVIGLKKN
jgi:hypothetical protein